MATQDELAIARLDAGIAYWLKKDGKVSGKQNPYAQGSRRWRAWQNSTFILWMMEMDPECFE